MPMHDWTRVEPFDYHDFHFSWLAALKSALNGGLLPDGYFAMAEHTTPPIVPDVVTLTLGRAETLPGGGAGLAAPPAEFVNTAPARRLRNKPGGRRRVGVRHVRDRQLVAVIEVVSPSNKAKRSEFRDLVEKSALLLRQGVHLMLIDPLPPTARDPDGLHAAVWRELTGKRFLPPKDKPLTLVSYAAKDDETFTAYNRPVAVGDPLPDLPLFLTPTFHVATPLEATYQAAWAAFPKELRPLLEDPPAGG